MTFSLSNEIRNARLQVVVDTLDGGAGAGYIEFYDGVRPETGGAVTTLLSTHLLSGPCGVVLDQVLTFNTIEDDISADAAANATWARFYDGDGAFQMDADCGIEGSGADFIFDDVAILLGGLIRVTAGSISEGNG